MLLKHDIAQYLRNGLGDIVKTMSPPTPYIPKERILPWGHEQTMLQKPYALFFLGPWREDISRRFADPKYREVLEPGATVYTGTAQPTPTGWHLYDPNTDFEALELYQPLFVIVDDRVANAVRLSNKNTIVLSQPIGPTQNPKAYVLKDPILKRAWYKPGIMRLQTTVIADNEVEADTIADAFHDYLICPTGFNRVLEHNRIGARVIDHGQVLPADFIEPRPGRDQTWARRRDIIVQVATSELMVKEIPLIRSVKLTVKAGSHPLGLPCEPYEERLIVHA